MSACIMSLRQMAPKASTLLTRGATAATLRANRTLATGSGIHMTEMTFTEHVTMNEKPASGSRTIEWFTTSPDDVTPREHDVTSATFDDLANIVNPDSDADIFRRWI